MSSTVRRFAVGADSDLPVRTVSVIGGLFLLALTTTWAWWAVTVAYEPVLRAWFGLDTFVFGTVQLWWMPGVMGLAFVAAALHAYRGGGALVGVSLAPVAFQGYQTGAYLAGVVHGGGPVENLLRFGLPVGVAGYAVGFTALRVRGRSDVDWMPSLSRRRVAVVLAAGFAIGFRFAIPTIEALA